MGPIPRPSAPVRPRTLTLRYTPKGGTEITTGLTVAKRDECTYYVGQTIRIWYDYFKPDTVGFSVNTGPGQSGAGNGLHWAHSGERRSHVHGLCHPPVLSVGVFRCACGETRTQRAGYAVERGQCGGATAAADQVKTRSQRTLLNNAVCLRHSDSQ